MRTLLLSADEPPDVRHAAELLRDGRLVAFPTETVYGLGARADDEEALGALCCVKERPSGKKFTVLIADPQDWRLYTGAMSAAATALAESFWPGPLTLVVPDGRGEEVGLRCPDCAPARQMLREVGAPVVAPSANVSGARPALTAAEVLAVFEGRLAAVLDGGRALLGRASTVVRVRGEKVEILREGALDKALVRGVG